MLPQTLDLIKKLSREEIVAILEQQGGYQCYDHESVDDLRETLRSDIERGILPASILQRVADA